MKFDFYLPVEVLFGSRRLDTLGEVAKRYGYRAIIITGKKVPRKTEL